MPVQMQHPNIDFSALESLGQIPERMRMRDLRSQFSSGAFMGPNGELDYPKMIQALGGVDPAMGAKTAIGWEDSKALGAYRNDSIAAQNRPQYNADVGGFVDETNQTIIPAEGGGHRNPYAPMGKQTDAQAKAADQARRAAEAYKIITENSGVFETEGNVSAAAQLLPEGGITGWARNALSSSPRQQFDTAVDEFVNAINRRDSGQQVKDSERQSTINRYVPMRNDKPEVRAQKEKARRTVLEGIFGAAGPNFVPPDLNAPPPQANPYNDEGESWSQPAPGGSVPTQAGAAPLLPNGMADPAPQPKPEHVQKLQALLAQFQNDPAAQAEIMAEWERKYPQFGRGAADHFLGRDVQAGR